MMFPSISGIHWHITPRLWPALSLLLLGTLGLAACRPEEQLPTDPTEGWRLGTFQMNWNGQQIDGNLASIVCDRTQIDNLETDASFSFTEHTVDMYEQRDLSFMIQRRVGYYEIDTIRPDGTHHDDWPYPEVSYFHDIEFGHVVGVRYLPILHDTIADFIAVDSIVEGVFHGRFQVSLVSELSTRPEVPHAPDTVVIRDGRFDVREYLGG